MKKIICVAIIVTVASIAVWNFHQNKKNTLLSDLAMANIEALARAEIGDADYTVTVHDLHHWTCYAGGSSYCPLN